MGTIAKRNWTRHVLLTLTRLDSECPRYGVLSGMAEEGVCPMEFPELGVDDCRYDPRTECHICWAKALGIDIIEEE